MVHGLGTVGEARYEPDVAVQAGPDPFGLRDRRGSGRDHLLAHAGVVRAGVGVRHRDPANGQDRAGFLDRREVALDADHREGVEDAAGVQAAAPGERAPRLKAVQAPVRPARVFGQVDPAPTVEGHGLMLEAAHSPDRLGVAKGPGVDLEDVAVWLAEHLVGLLAGQPGLPGGSPARAVGEGPRQADAVGPQPAAPADPQGRCAADALGIVGGAPGGGAPGPGRPRRSSRGRARDCGPVRAEQAAPEGGHAVVAGRHAPARRSAARPRRRGPGSETPPADRAAPPDPGPADRSR